MSRRFLPDPKVARRYNVHPTTIWRWDQDPTLGFPAPIRINNRKYRDVELLDAWDQTRVGITPIGITDTKED